LIKCHTAWIWYSGKDNAANSIRYYDRLTSQIYNRAIDHTALKQTAMDAANQNDYWKHIGDSNSEKSTMVTAALSVTTMFKGETEVIQSEEIIRLVQP
jgi:hypothetical protein